MESKTPTVFWEIFKKDEPGPALTITHKQCLVELDVSVGNFPYKEGLLIFSDKGFPNKVDTMW